MLKPYHRMSVPMVRVSCAALGHACPPTGSPCHEVLRVRARAWGLSDTVRARAQLCHLDRGGDFSWGSPDSAGGLVLVRSVDNLDPCDAEIGGVARARDLAELAAEGHYLHSCHDRSELVHGFTVQLGDGAVGEDVRPGGARRVRGTRTRSAWCAPYAAGWRGGVSSGSGHRVAGRSR